MDEALSTAVDSRIPEEYRRLAYWEQGFDTAKRWYHEEWNGSYIQLALARDIAAAIAATVKDLYGHV